MWSRIPMQCSFKQALPLTGYRIPLTKSRISVQTRSLISRSNLSNNLPARSSIPTFLASGRGQAIVHRHNYNRSASTQPKTARSHAKTGNMAASIEATMTDKYQEYSLPYSSLTNLDPELLATIQTQFGYGNMSQVQASVLSKLPTQRDMLVKAKTGTGKTLAFIVAALESLLQSQKRDPTVQALKAMGGICCVMVAPTRELALQITEEAEKLLKPLGWGVHCFVGGESKGKQLERLSKEPAEFVVATPGRIKDLLGNTEFKDKFQGAQVLVLDEADTILQLGFRAELESILENMPKDRQTLLFSATMDPKLEALSTMALKPNHIFIDTIGDKQVNLNLATRQLYCIAPYRSHFALVRRIINDHMLEVQSSLTASEDKSAKAAKMIVFLPTTRGAQLYAKVFAALSMGRELSVFEMHSAKHQRERTLTSRNFKKIKSPAVLFTSDISARGVDYPGVDLVVQVGAPISHDHYIHRVGRTGRAGLGGKGILILSEMESGFIRQLQELPVQPESKYADWQSVVLGESLDRGFKRAMEKVDEKLAKSAYTAFLGYNLTVGPKIGNTDRRTILQAADEYLAAFGIEERPSISVNFLHRMGFTKQADQDYQKQQQALQAHHLEDGMLSSDDFPGKESTDMMASASQEHELVDGSVVVGTLEPQRRSLTARQEAREIGEDGLLKLSRKRREEAFLQKNAALLPETEFVKIHEADWEDLMENKNEMPKLIAKLHSPQRMGQVGNRPSKKLAKIFSNNSGW